MKLQNAAKCHHIPPLKQGEQTELIMWKDSLPHLVLESIDNLPQDTAVRQNSRLHNAAGTPV
jgi:hypothetical protein